MRKPAKSATASKPHTMYEVSLFGDRVNLVKVTRESVQFYFVERSYKSFSGRTRITEHRISKGSERLHPTFAEAKAKVVQRAENYVESCRAALAEAEAELRKVKALRRASR